MLTCTAFAVDHHCLRSERLHHSMSRGSASHPNNFGLGHQFRRPLRVQSRQADEIAPNCREPTTVLGPSHKEVGTQSQRPAAPCRPGCVNRRFLDSLFHIRLSFLDSQRPSLVLSTDTFDNSECTRRLLPCKTCI